MTTIKCPKCGHVRSDKDDPLIPDYQCPACDVVYQKYIQLQAKKRETNQATETQPPQSNHADGSSLMSSVASFIGGFASFASEAFTRTVTDRPEPTHHQEPEPMVNTKAKPKPSVSDTEKIIALSEINQIRTSHLLHLVLTLVTVGFWIFPWILVTVSNTRERNKIRRRAQLPTESNWMGVALSVLAIGIFIVLAGTCTSAASGLYDYVGKQDTSYANVKRGSIRIKIPGNRVPGEAELQQIAVSAWTAYREWPNGRVFVYVKDMPTNSTAYAVAEFEQSRLKQFSIMSFALEMQEALKQRR